MKNDIFNFRRFGKYFASDIRTCYANYGLSLLSISMLSLVISYLLYAVLSLIFGGEWIGLPVGARAFIFAFVMFLITVTMPVKCYGQLTQKQYGMMWLMVPVSKFEKFLSMIILSCIIVPVLGAFLYLGLDAIICAVDHTCGSSLLYTAFDGLASIREEIAVEKELLVESRLYSFSKQITSPWLYLDDVFGISLPFVLGALVFKKGKTAKTILSLAALGTFSSIVCVPLMMDWANALSDMNLYGDLSANDLNYVFDHGIFKNVGLYDTMSDTLANLAFLAAIYFRIKTLKH